MMNKRFGFVLFDQFEDLDFFGPWEIFGVWSQQFEGPNELILISEHGAQVNSKKGLVIETHKNFENCAPLDYLLVPGGLGTRQEVNNKKLITFLKEKAVHCEYVLSVCTGVFLLHAAGLVSGKKVTTHWNSIDRLSALNDVAVVKNQRYVRDGHLWSSAGISAGVDMALAFVAEIAGDEIAGNVQLEAEFYPSRKVYQNKLGHFPGYLDSD